MPLFIHWTEKKNPCYGNNHRKAQKNEQKSLFYSNPMDKRRSAIQLNVKIVVEEMRNVKGPKELMVHGKRWSIQLDEVGMDWIKVFTVINYKPSVSITSNIIHVLFGKLETNVHFSATSTSFGKLNFVHCSIEL